jgi:acid stress-induced BolA-like protein IbaG/YrbA
MPADPVLKKKVEEILRIEFPNETVDVSDGHADNIHVVVVSQKFSQMHEKEKQDLLWDAINKSSLADSEKVKISLILPYSPADLK